MGFFDGLGAASGGFVSGMEAGQGMQARKLDLLNAQDQRAGQAAFGRTLQSLGGMPPTQQQAPPTILDHIKSLLTPQAQRPPSMVPQAMQQGGGQPMMPQAPQGGGPPMAPQGGGGQPMMPQAPQGGGPPMAPQGGGGPPPMPQGGNAPPPQPQAPPMQPQAPQQPQQGQLDWRQIAQKVAQANPGASPQVIAHAVSGFLPLMTQQAQQDWKQVQMQVLQDNAKTRALAEKDSAQAHADATQQRADAAALASQDRNAAIEEKATAAAAALEQKKTEAETNEFTRISTAYEKLNAATASNPARDTPANQALIQRLQARMGEMAGVPPDAVAKIAATKGPEQSWGSWFKETVGLGGADAAAKTPDPSKPAPVANDASSGSSEGPPVTSTALSQPTQDWVTKQMQRGVSRADIDAYLKAHPEIK